MLENLCTPALIYLIFSITQITIDIFKKDYNVALVKFTVAFIFTILLNYLCSSGLGIVSWIIVFIPFILMSVIVSYILTFFGIDPKTNEIRILKNGEELKDDEKKEEDEKNDETTPVLSNVSATYSEGDNKIIINYTSSKEGKIWCKAILKSENKSPTIAELKEKQSQKMLSGDNNICNITDYLENNEYDVYMYAEDVKSNGMNLADLLETKKTLITSTSTSTSPPANTPANPPANTPANPPANPPANTPANPPANTPANPPANPPANQPATSGFENMKSNYSNFFHNNSRLYKERKQHIDHINKVLINLNETDNSAYFLIQSDTCANKTTNREYELCMKRLLQEILSRIRKNENKNKFLQSLNQTKINISGLNNKLI